MAIRYYDQEIKSGLAEKRKLSSFLQALIRGKRAAVKTIDLTYVFCGDNYLLEINQEFLKHNTLTDIITFDMSEREAALNGEIYISVERVRENATKFGVSYQHELHRVIFHGALHLCGFKDKTPEDRANMRAQEDLCISGYFGA